MSSYVLSTTERKFFTVIEEYLEPYQEGSMAPVSAVIDGARSSGFSPLESCGFLRELDEARLVDIEEGTDKDGLIEEYVTITRKGYEAMESFQYKQTKTQKRKLMR